MDGGARNMNTFQDFHLLAEMADGLKNCRAQFYQVAWRYIPQNTNQLQIRDNYHLKALIFEGERVENSKYSRYVPVYYW